MYDKIYNSLTEVMLKIFRLYIIYEREAIVNWGLSKRFKTFIDQFLLELALKVEFRQLFSINLIEKFKLNFFSLFKRYEYYEPNSSDIC